MTGAFTKAIQSLYLTNIFLMRSKKNVQLAAMYENKREKYLCKHNNILYKGVGIEGYIDIQKVKLCRIVDNKEF